MKGSLVFHRCLAICHECSIRTGRPLVHPFGDLATLDAWHLAHVRPTNHEVVDVNGWPSPSVAFRDAFGDEAYRDAFGANAYRTAFGADAYRAAFIPRNPHLAGNPPQPRPSSRRG